MTIHIVLVFLLLTNIQAQQQPCSCSCCYGRSCNVAPLPTIHVQQCTLQSCLAQCRSTYPQCQVNYPYGDISVQCGSTTMNSSMAQYKCRCECCKTGSSACTPSYVGDTTAYTCRTGACSISCTTQYPYQCVSDGIGQTQGTCVDIITTSTTTTTVGPWLGNSCSCMCCHQGSYCTPTYVGTASASYCSSSHCTQACRIQYPALCPTLTYTGQASGTCTSYVGGNAICKCSCCVNNNCISYDISASGGCSTCDTLCQQQPRCTNPSIVRYSCQTYNGKIYYYPSMVLIFLTTFLTFLI